MPPSPASQVVVVDGASPPELTIISWPLRDEPLAAAIVLVIAASVSVAAGVIAASWLVGIASAAALLVALRNLLLPVEFRLNELGVKRSILGRSRRTPWREIADCRFEQNGVLLLPDANAAPLQWLRGIYVPYRQHQTALVAMVEYYLRNIPRAAIKEHLVGQHRS